MSEESIRWGLAVADLDRDGQPEILGLTDSHIKVLDARGKLLARARRSPPGGVCAIAVAEIDGEDPAELADEGSVYRYQKGNPSLVTLFENPRLGNSADCSTFADLDENGKFELLTGQRVYDAETGADVTPALLKTIRAPWNTDLAVADFNRDGRPDQANISRIETMVSIFDLLGNRFLLGPQPHPARVTFGIPIFGDADGDGMPELVVGDDLGLSVYSFRCTMSPKGCAGKGALWRKEIPGLSEFTGQTALFDLNGDGAIEIVHHDLCWMQFYDGRSGGLLSATPLTTYPTREGFPVVVDADGDGSAEIVVASASSEGRCPAKPHPLLRLPWTGDTSGIFVLSDPEDRWAGTRPLWTSFNYHVTEIQDDLTVPKREVPHWRSHNSFRRNLQGPGRPVPIPRSELTAAWPEASPEGPLCGTGPILHARICNRGQVAARGGVAGTFYDGERERAESRPICTAYTTRTLAPGECEEIWCEVPDPAHPPDVPVVHFYANDHGNGQNRRPECHQGNNWLPMKVSCMQ